MALDVNVSVAKNAGNNQCSAGTSSTFTISEASLGSDQRFSFSFLRILELESACQITDKRNNKDDAAKDVRHSNNSLPRAARYE